MAIQVPSGLITSQSGTNSLPITTTPIPVVIVGANGAGASGNHTITDASGSLNVTLNSGAAISISGDIILVVSGGTIQTSGSTNVVSGGGPISVTSGGTIPVSVLSGSLTNIISASGNKITDFSGAINVNISGGSVGTTLAGYQSGTLVGISGGAIGLSGLTGVSISGSATIITSGVNQVTVSASGGLALTHESATQFNLRTSIWNGGSEAGVGGSPVDAQAGQGGIFVISQNDVFNGTNWDRIRSVDAVSGGKTSGIGILASEIMAFDLSGAAHRQLITGASGSQTLQAGLYWRYNHISGANLVNVQSGASVVHTVSVNFWVSGGQVTIYNSLSGANAADILATIDYTEVGSLATNAFTPQTMIYDAFLSSGIVVATSGANIDVTVTFKNPP